MIKLEGNVLYVGELMINIPMSLKYKDLSEKEWKLFFECVLEQQDQLAKANECLNNPQGLQELVCLEQMKDIPLLEIHRAHQRLHEENNQLNERVEELEQELKGLAHESTQSIQRWRLRAEKAEEQLHKEQDSE